MFSRFFQLLSSIIDNFIPARPHKSSSIPSWSVKSSSILKRQRSTAWSHFKLMCAIHGRNSDITADALSIFLDINHQFRNFSITCQTNHESSLVDQLTWNPKVFHSYIRRKKVGRPCIGPLKSSSSLVIADPYAMAELFAYPLLQYTQLHSLMHLPHIKLLI